MDASSVRVPSLNLDGRGVHPTSALKHLPETFNLMPRPLRVLFVIGTLGGGGAERQVVEILKQLDRSRFEPVLSLGSCSGELLSEVPADVPIHSFWEDFLKTWAFPFHRLTRTVPIARWRHLARLLESERIDIVYDRTFLATLDAAAACWFRPTPRIACCVADPAWELNVYARRMPLFARRFARWAYSSASVVLANSDGLRERLVRFFDLPDEHVRTLRNLVDFDRIERLASESTPSIPRDPFLIVSGGRLHVQKGQQYLLEAIRILVQERGRSLHFVSLGQGEQERELREFIATHQLEAHVTLPGFVANPLPWYRQARLFVLPSLNEGFPNALLEAVACGTPVLATDCPRGPSEILDAGRCGHLVPPADATALANAIADCMDHEADWQSLTNAARDRVRQLCDPREGLNQLEALLEQTAVRDQHPPL